MSQMLTPCDQAIIAKLLMDGPRSIRDASRLRFKLPSPSIISAFTSSSTFWPWSSTERSAIAEHFQFETLLRPPPSQPLPMFHWFHDGARGRYCTFILHHRQAGHRAPPPSFSMASDGAANSFRLHPPTIDQNDY